MPEVNDLRNAAATPMNQSQPDAARIARSILGMLEHARLRPAMYFQPVDFYSFENYFNGLATGVRVALQSTGTTDFPGMWEIREGVANERGYKVPIISVCQLEEQMRLRWTELSQVVNERFEIEIAAWRKLLESFETVEPT